MKPFVRGLVLLTVLAGMCASALAMEDGVYRDQADGYGGKVIVTVLIRDGRIMELTTENTGGEKSEYYLKAEEALAAQIVEKQGIDGVDAVAGATGTSESILEAMRGILEQAAYTGAPLGSMNQTVEDGKDALMNGAERVKEGVEDAAESVMDGAENTMERLTTP